MNQLIQLLILVTLPLLIHATATDDDPRCSNWAAVGECAANPSYMLTHCAASCAASEAATAAEQAAVAAIDSFFDLPDGKDIHGKTVSFADLRNQVTIVVNVASYCGYTESHYKGLVELWSEVKETAAVHILAYPCNQFGQQEPGTADEIAAFAKNKGVEFTIMSKVDVNGPGADLVFKFLKQKTGVTAIQWNFATYFVIGPDGGITQHSGVEPMDLKGYALSLLKEEL